MDYVLAAGLFGFAGELAAAKERCSVRALNTLMRAQEARPTGWPSRCSSTRSLASWGLA